MKFLLFIVLLLNIGSSLGSSFVSRVTLEHVQKTLTGAKHLLYMQDPEDPENPNGKLFYLLVLTAKSNGQHEFNWYKASKTLPELYELMPDAQLTISLLLLDAYNQL